jgi:hypothetical protein
MRGDKWDYKATPTCSPRLARRKNWPSTHPENALATELSEHRIMANMTSVLGERGRGSIRQSMQHGHVL